ncbi:acid protease [Lophium mytilinum]|uniref:Acid protease n=1 Tax=Lophium mytilinum TaxID=390894 RepID=A0A6A6QA93_9PEZI|nr:acid protease [Lophium mytilinum]
MASLLYFLSASVLFAQSTAFNCSKAPIYVDIHKRAVHGTDVFQYGSFIGVGNPAQNQSLWPSLIRNHTVITDSHYCDHSSLSNCAQSTRGNFDTLLSTSFVEENNFQSLDHNISDLNGTFTGEFGQDDLHLYTHFFESDGASQNLITNYTVEVATNGSAAPGIVGMGYSSTLLQTLYDQNMIAGRTYSLYIGSGMDRAGGVINGSNVFGGYDAGRFKGDVHKYPMRTDDASPFPVTVQDIVISDGGDSTSNISLFDPASFSDLKSRPDPFEARLTTEQYPLSLPYAITQNYIKKLSAGPSGNSDGSLKLNKPFAGTMTIILSDGFTITMPNNVMFNASGISPVAARDENSTEPFLLSVAFLSQVYLMADYDTYQFFLATAIQEQKAVMPRTFCPKSTPVPYIPPKTSSFAHQGMIGAVIGGVVGGIGLICFASCLFLGIRSSRAARKAERAEEEEKARGKATMLQFDIDDKMDFDAPPRTATPFFWNRR